MFKDINKSEAEYILQNTQSVLFDIRDIQNYNEGHLKKAIHLSADNLEEVVNSIEPEIPILVMCYHGISSQLVAQMFVDRGFTEVYSIEGGYCGWTGEE